MANDSHDLHGDVNLPAEADVPDDIAAALTDRLDIDDTVPLRTREDLADEYAAILEADTPLTTQQAHVVAMYRCGLERREIAAELDISPNTVKDYRRAALDRLASARAASELVFNHFPGTFLPDHLTTETGTVTVRGRDFDATVAVYTNLNPAPHPSESATDATATATDTPTDAPHAQYALVEERTASAPHAQGTQTTRRIWGFSTFDRLLWDGYATRYFEGDGWARLVEHALTAATAARASDDTVARADVATTIAGYRDSVQQTAHDTYQQVADGELSADAAATQLGGMGADWVRENVRVLQRARGFAPDAAPASDLAYLALVPKQVRDTVLHKPTTARAATVYENFDAWSEPTADGDCITSGDLRRALDDALAWSELYRVMDEFDAKTSDAYELRDPSDQSKRLLRTEAT